MVTVAELLVDCGNELKRVQWHDSVIMVCGEEQGGRVVDPSRHVVKRGVPGTNITSAYCRIWAMRPQGLGLERLMS